MFKDFLWAFAEKGSQIAFQFISVIVLGRLLCPQDFGIYGTMMIFIAIATLLTDSGFGGALVQRKSINQADINTLFVTNISISVFLYIILFFTSPLIANFYKITSLTYYLRVFGIVIIIYSLNIVHFTLLQREMRFKESATVILLASLFSFVSVICAAYLGLKVWALIIQQLVMAFTTTILLWSKEKRNIKLDFSKKSFHNLWSFGSKLLFANLIQTAYNNVSTSIVPKIDSLSVSGMYVQASRLNSIPINIIINTVDKVAFTMLCKEKKQDLLILKARQVNKIIFAFVIPLFPILSLFAKEFVYILLGDKWLEVDRFLAILSLGGLGLIIQALYRNIFKSLGQTSIILSIDIMKAIIGFFIFALSLKLGIIFMIYGITISMFLGALGYSFFLVKMYRFGFIKQLSDMFIPLIISFILYIISSYILNLLDFHWYNIFGTLVYYFIYILLNVIVGNKIIIDILQQVKTSLFIPKKEGHREL